MFPFLPVIFFVNNFAGVRVFLVNNFAGVRVFLEKVHLRESIHRTHTVKANMSEITLTEQAWDSGHDIDWDSCKIVDKKSLEKRKHLEFF